MRVRLSPWTPPPAAAAGGPGGHAPVGEWKILPSERRASRQGSPGSSPGRRTITDPGMIQGGRHGLQSRVRWVRFPLRMPSSPSGELAERGWARCPRPSAKRWAPRGRRVRSPSVPPRKGSNGGSCGRLKSGRCGLDTHPFHHPGGRRRTVGDPPRKRGCARAQWFDSAVLLHPGKKRSKKLLDGDVVSPIPSEATCLSPCANRTPSIETSSSRWAAPVRASGGTPPPPSSGLS